MTTTQQREQVAKLIEEAKASGARSAKACKIIGIDIRTLQRWKPVGERTVREDQRPLADRPEPAHKLSPEERQQVLEICNQPEYASLPPSQIVPKLADQGTYLASESTFYRVLKENNQLNHRGRAQAPRVKRLPTTHIAQASNQVWTWDISYLPSTVKGQFFYLYMVEDIYSRYSVIWEVHESESGELAADLFEKAIWREHLRDQRPVLHSDNGSPMKSFTLRAKLEQLGITTSFSRPRVSDDNAYVESFFKTLKYGPTWPSKGFATVNDARQWVQKFMHWYNNEHQHSKIQFVTPAQRHRGEDKAILANRIKVYTKAKAKHPKRWSKDIRNWTPAGDVALNPDQITKEKLKKMG
jgi:putative transposase